MKILVTGGCGFIGSNFIRHLFDTRSKAVSVVNLDKLTYAANPANLADLAHHSDYRFIKGDIADPDVVRVAMDGCDAVVNFAAETHVDRSLLGDASFIETDVRGVFVLLEEARRRGRLSKFIQIARKFSPVFFNHDLRGTDEVCPIAQPESTSRQNLAEERLRAVLEEGHLAVADPGQCLDRRVVDTYPHPSMRKRKAKR